MCIYTDLSYFMFFNLSNYIKYIQIHILLLLNVLFFPMISSGSSRFSSVPPVLLPERLLVPSPSSGGEKPAGPHRGWVQSSIYGGKHSNHLNCRTIWNNGGGWSKGQGRRWTLLCGTRRTLWYCCCPEDRDIVCVCVLYIK